MVSDETDVVRRGAGWAGVSADGGAAPVVVVDRVTKRFGRTVALCDCSIRIRPGEVHAIVGENGSGKSTLTRIISGVMPPDAGSVTVFGRRPTSPRSARRLGVATIFQEILVADGATVTDNLFVGSGGLLRRRPPPQEAGAQARALMRRLAGEAVDCDALVGALPLGIKQWIVIGRALLARPRVLLLDESSAALDLDATARLHDEIRALRDDGAAVVIVTHRIAELVGIAERATVLRDGAVVGELGRGEITEETLLAVMMPAKAAGHAARAGAAPASPGRVRRLPLLRFADRVDTPAEFALHAGEIVGLAGLDGQGQERFLLTLAGLATGPGNPPVARDEDGAWQPVRDLRDAEALGIAYVSGDRKREGIFPNLGIYENLVIGLMRRDHGPLGWLAHGRYRPAFAAEVARLGIKIGGPADRITTLSGGNQQKVLIGRALAGGPRILAMNDPARGIDIGTKLGLYAQLRQFAAGGGAVVYLTSEIEELLGFADRVLVFREGRPFRGLAGAEITEHAMLAAMFGHGAAAGPGTVAQETRQ